MALTPPPPPPSPLPIPPSPAPRYYFQCLPGDVDVTKLGWAFQIPYPDPARTECKAWPLLNEQCGGTGGACDPAKHNCPDATWPDTCCLEGACTRTDASYWECR